MHKPIELLHNFKKIYTMFNNERLKKLRKDLKFSQEEMAKELNMHQTTYSRYETNEADINLQMLQTINEKFNINPNEFFNQNNPVVNFENGSTNNGNGILQTENFTTTPKDILEIIVKNQENIVQQNATFLELLKQYFKK